MKTGEDFRREFPEAEAGFREAERTALLQLSDQQRRSPMKLRPVIALILILALMMSVGVAATVEKWSLFDSVPEHWRTASDAEKAQMKSSFVPVFIDGNRVDVTIREAIYDGFGVYMVFDMQPDDPQVFLIPDMNAELDQPACDTVSTFPADVTLREHIRALGYTKIYQVGCSNGVQGMFFPATLELNEDGSFSFFLRQRLNQARDQQQPELGIHFSAWMNSGGYSTEYLEADISLVAQPVMEAKISPADESFEFVSSGMRMSNVQVHRTILTTYVIADVEIIDQEAFDNRHMQYFLHVKDGDGNDIPPGYFNLISVMQDAETGRYRYTCTLSMKSIPDMLSIVEYQVDWENGHKPVNSWVFETNDME